VSGANRETVLAQVGESEEQSGRVDTPGNRDDERAWRDCGLPEELS
jgi:hypothetical protein